MREIIQEARNVEEAIDLACKKLGVQRDQIEFEIINLPKRGFFGLRNTPAKVHVSVDEPEPIKPEPKQEAVRAPKADKPAPQKLVQQKQEPKKPRQEAPQAGKTVVEEAKEPPKQTPPAELQFLDASQTEGKARTAADYVKAVLGDMDITAEVSVALTDNGIILRLSGEGLGVIIGRRGETLDSLQYLAGLAANRQEGDYMRVTIDSGNYREKREHTLELLAKKLAASAVRYGRPSTLEPMNPYERRIIHSTVSKIDGVSSSSIGEEPNRRVVITPDRLRPQENRGGRGKGRPGGARPPRKNDRREDGDKRRPDNRPNRAAAPRPPRSRDKAGETVRPTSTEIDRAYAQELTRSPRPAQPAQSAPQQEQKPAPARKEIRREGEDLPLYGKIEL